MIWSHDMHPDIHLRLHHIRAAELHSQAEHCRQARPHRRSPWSAVSRRLGWKLVETGLYLVNLQRT
jgi:hypothetical protein